MATSGEQRPILTRPFRSSLPVKTHERRKARHSILTILKKLATGMDVTRVCFPISFCSPISHLQAEADRFHFAKLLRFANNCDDPVERMTLVTAFLVSCLSTLTSLCRQMQFNLMISGETFEFCRPDLGFRMVSECLSLSPPCIATFVESVNQDGNPDGVFKLILSEALQLSFRGKSIECFPTSRNVYVFPQRQEAYSLECSHKMIWSNFLRGLSQILGRIDGHIDIHRFDMTTKSRCGLKSSVNFYPPVNGVDFFGGWSVSDDPVRCDGCIELADGTRPITLFGAYSQELWSVPTPAWQAAGGWQSLASVKGNKSFEVPGQRLLWRKGREQEPQPNYFMLSEYLMQVNELTSELQATLPPTDSRFRKDIRLLEQGFTDEAEECKMKIEAFQQQRMTRTGMRDSLNPTWFYEDCCPFTGEPNFWVFRESYWQRDWSKCHELNFLCEER